MYPSVTEFQSIMPMANISSVLKHGILSHELASKLPHASLAMDANQERRDKKQVPGGLKLHQYANLYFHARNPMLYKRKAQAPDLCILRISTEVALKEGVVFADSNASSDYVRFLGPSQWRLLDFDSIFAMDWSCPNDCIAYYRARARKCAEVLVPHRVEVRYLTGAWAVNDAASRKLQELGFPLPIEIDPVLFFR